MICKKSLVTWVGLGLSTIMIGMKSGREDPPQDAETRLKGLPVGHMA